MHFLSFVYFIFCFYHLYITQFFFYYWYITLSFFIIVLSHTPLPSILCFITSLYPPTPGPTLPCRKPLCHFIVCCVVWPRAVNTHRCPCPPSNVKTFSHHRHLSPSPVHCLIVVFSVLPDGGIHQSIHVGHVRRRRREHVEVLVLVSALQRQPQSLVRLLQVEEHA